MTFARSHGPRQPSLIVNVIEADSRLFRHSWMSHSTGTGGFRFSVTPQQQPLQTSICTKTRRFDVSLGDASILSALISFSRILFKSPIGVADDIPLLSELDVYQSLPRCESKYSTSSCHFAAISCAGIPFFFHASVHRWR